MKRATNPFSAQRAASPDMFFGYDGPSPRSLGGWKLEEITGCWLQCEDAVPSFWAAGERKMGKTSLLLRLENLLCSLNRPDMSRLAVPLYVSCRDVTSLNDFYRLVLERAVLIPMPKEGAASAVIDPAQFGLLQPGKALAEFELFDHAVEDLGKLVSQLSQGDGSRARIVLLIDDISDAARHAWPAALFEHLRTLLRGYPFPRSDVALRREDLSLVIAGDRNLETLDGARRLLEILEELPLHTLDATEVSSLITSHCDIRQRHFLPHRIYRATAGHPWLVQFVMENIAGSPNEEQEPDLDLIVKKRFRAFEEGTRIFQHYLDSLLDRSTEILAYLALGDSTAESLAAKTGLSGGAVNRRLEQMLSFGIVGLKTLGEGRPSQSQYYLGEIFKQWFLAHTGGGVLLAEVEHLRSAEESKQKQIKVSDNPFTLTLSVRPEFILADGLYARLLPSDNDFGGYLEMVDVLVRNEGKKDIMDIVARSLNKALQQDKWESVWNDYVEKAPEQGRNPRFVLRVGSDELFDFPIEMLSFKGRPLGLEWPVYKEVMAGQRELAYRLYHRMLLSEKLNILVVGSARGGRYEDRIYDELKLVESEVTEVCRALRATVPGQRLEIGEVVALVDWDATLPRHVRKEELSPVNFSKALQGELGVGFHLLHYAGHYVPNRQQVAGGFLLHDGKDLKLFNIGEWYNALARTTLRLACLSACGSAAHVSDANLYHFGAAHAALTTGVPVVIGMRWSIRDGQAQEFSRSFYPHLLKTGVPEIALFETRRELYGKDGGSTLWAAPVMLTR